MEDIALVFRSLEDETRLRIMALLLEREELCVCDIMAVLQMPQSTVSRQLSLLRKAGWLKDRRVGVWIHYSVSRSLPPMHQFLLPVLRNFLRDTDPARVDRERFEERSKACCA